jgi:Uri superfamily endonuclease
MTGFETSFRGTTISASVDEGFVYVGVSYCRGHLTLVIRGYNKTEFINWHTHNIDDVDEVIIKVVDVVQNSEPENTISKDLSYYNDLKQRLKKEGLI